MWQTQVIKNGHNGYVNLASFLGARGQFHVAYLAAKNVYLVLRRLPVVGIVYAIDYVAFHVPYLDYAIDAMHYLAYATYPHCVNPLSTT